MSREKDVHLLSPSQGMLKFDMCELMYLSNSLDLYPQALLRLPRTSLKLYQLLSTLLLVLWKLHGGSHPLMFL